MKRKLYMVCMMSLVFSTLTGCAQNRNTLENMVQTKTAEGENMAKNIITPDTKITELEDGLSVVRYEGNYGFDEFLRQGGASSDEGVVEYVAGQLSSNIPELLFGAIPSDAAPCLWQIQKEGTCLEGTLTGIPVTD